MKREHANHNLPTVVSSPYIRALSDVVTIDNGDAQILNDSETETSLYLVVEWMENDLRTVPSDRYRENSSLPKVIARSVLSALALLKTEYNAIHTGECLSLFHVLITKYTRYKPE